MSEQGITGRGGGFEIWASRAAAALPNALRRIPFTLTFLGLLILVGLVSQTVFTPIWQRDWFPSVAYGVPPLRDGWIWTFVTGWFFALTPGQFLGSIILFALLVGSCELRLGTRRTAVTWMLGRSERMVSTED